MEDNKKMPGYTGYIPQFLTEESNPNTRDNRFFIPGKQRNYELLIIF